MKRSTDRILTTHTGSLARPTALLDLLDAKVGGRPYDAAAFASTSRAAVAEIVRQQAANGVDVVSDGELAKPQFSDYVADRLSGLEGHNAAGGFVNPTQRPEPFPEYAAWVNAQNPAALASPGGGIMAQRRPMCIAPLGWKDRAYEADIANLKAALAGTNATEAFLPSPSPGILAMRIPNQYYKSEEEYLFALADVMKDEYRAITDAGLMLQIDAPDTAMAWDRQQWADLAEFRSAVDMRIAALNHALTDVPEEQVRFHVCWGNGERPHVNDVALRDIVDLVLKVKATAYSIESSNPRHAHEWEVWQDVKLPAGKTLIPGVIDSLTNFVEHPELVAQRLERHAGLVGRENVMAGTDCGFGTGASANPRVHPELVWAKFRSMQEGAQIATKRLKG